MIKVDTNRACTPSLPVIRAHVRNGLLPVHGVTGGEEEAKTGDAAASAVRVVVRFIDSVGAVVGVVPLVDVGRTLLLSACKAAQRGQTSAAAARLNELLGQCIASDCTHAQSLQLLCTQRHG